MARAMSSDPATPQNLERAHRLLSRATRTLERITVNPLVEESISPSTVNPAWDRFPTPLSVIRPVSL